MAVKNGRISTSQMRKVDGWAYLAPGAAAAWLLFAFKAQMKWGIRPAITRPDGAYRSYARQLWWWVRRYIFHVVVAVPGTSNHGLGMAIDVYNWARFPRAAFVALARAHGFIFDTPSEGWHMRYIGAPKYLNAPKSLTTKGKPMRFVLREKTGEKRYIEFSDTHGTRVIDGAHAHVIQISPGNVGGKVRVWVNDDIKKLRDTYGATWKP